MFVADALILDAIDQRQALGAIDGLASELDEMLRVALEVIEATARQSECAQGCVG